MDKTKDGGTRFCVVYRKFSGVTRKDAYPLPRIDETVDEILDVMCSPHWIWPAVIDRSRFSELSVTLSSALTLLQSNEIRLRLTYVTGMDELKKHKNTSNDSFSCLGLQCLKQELEVPPLARENTRTRVKTLQQHAEVFHEVTERLTRFHRHNEHKNMGYDTVSV